jgi:hypothetical protein
MPLCPPTGPLQLLCASGLVSTVRPSGMWGIREQTQAGRPFLYVAPRARVSSWPPTRLGRMRFERESVSVVCPPGLPPCQPDVGGEGMGRRCIGLDVHREFAQVVVWEHGRVRQAGKIDFDHRRAASVLRQLEP